MTRWLSLTGWLGSTNGSPQKMKIVESGFPTDTLRELSGRAKDVRQMVSRYRFRFGVATIVAMACAHSVFLCMYAFIALPTVSAPIIVSNYCESSGKTYSEDERALLLEFAGAFFGGFATICVLIACLQFASIVGILYVVARAVRNSNASTIATGWLGSTNGSPQNMRTVESDSPTTL